MWFHFGGSSWIFISRCNIWLLITAWLGQYNFVVEWFLCQQCGNWIWEPAYVLNGMYSRYGLDSLGCLVFTEKSHENECCSCFPKNIVTREHYSHRRKYFNLNYMHIMHYVQTQFSFLGWYKEQCDCKPSREQ